MVDGVDSGSTLALHGDAPAGVAFDGAVDARRQTTTTPSACAAGATDL